MKKYIFYFLLFAFGFGVCFTVFHKPIIASFEFKKKQKIAEEKRWKEIRSYLMNNPLPSRRKK